MSTEYGDAKSGSPSEAIASESTGLTLLSVVLTAGLTVALGVEANAWLRACLGVATMILLLVVIKLGTRTGRGPLSRLARWAVHHPAGD